MAKVFDMLDCGGCRTCELVCSYHNTGVFSLEMSSIKVLNKKDERGYLIKLVDKKEGFALPCDGCKNLEEPLCLQYCEKRESLEKIIKHFLDKKHN